MSTFSTTEHQAIAAADVRLADDERQPCEVWTRVMGYHRPVASFNAGKQGEHNQRRFFAEPLAEPFGTLAHDGTPVHGRSDPG